MEELLSQLKQLGFYRYEESETIEILERLSIQTSSPWVFDGKYQYDSLDTVTESDGVYINEGLLWLDAPHPQYSLCFLSREDLSECVYAYALEELKPILERAGAIVNDIDEFEADNGDSFLRLNEVDYLICPSAVNSFATRTIDKWNFVTAKTLLAANNLLAHAQSEEIIYVVRELDEDGLYIAILTSKMFGLIHENSLLINELKPQKIETYFAQYLDMSRYQP
ncbi:hypothetical protein [Microcoleus sp. D3_18a_C4]|uniref:hypothetical protein n=1 Tax=unclassified Microcoleus TaxID=2642155 RepID=UPI002FD0BACA